MIRDLDVFSEYDKQRVIAWNTKDPFAQNDCLHHLVHRSVHATPLAEAVCAWDGSLQYAELDALSSKLAETLTRAGVGPGVYVPFAFEKTLWTVVATLAIAKAGGAFVPLDPQHPRARIQEILGVVNAKVVVTSELYGSVFSDLVDTVLIASSKTLSVHKSNELEDQFLSKSKPEDPVFVLFTSGSTGQPKGMVHQHAAICSHTIAHGEAMGFHGARVLQFAAHTFDVAIIDIFTTLAFGGCVCIPSEEDRKNDLIGAINNLRVNFAILMPQVARLIRPSDVPTLRTLAVGGEPLPPDCIDRWADKITFIQIYGPAEVGICLMTPMTRRTLPQTVGYPLSNCGCWLVSPEDPHRLVPVGAVGELVVAGSSLALGYLNNAEKTRMSFPGGLDWAKQLAPQFQRFYMTGDLLRYNTGKFDGSFDFVGRKDSQIKLRGQRIEPGEIEHCIDSLPGVSVSLVFLPHRGCYAGELVAVIEMSQTKPRQSLAAKNHITAAVNQCLPSDVLKQYLSEKLPGYMIPTVHVEVHGLPFTPSMKLDRRCVKEWLEGLHSRPTAKAEGSLTELNPSALDVEELAANELSVKIAQLISPQGTSNRQSLEGRDFRIHEAGINSIHIMSLSMFIQRKFRTKVPMDLLLGSRVTVREIASIIDQSKQSASHRRSSVVDVMQKSEALTQLLFAQIEAHPLESRPRKSRSIRNVLLTGATGYLGSAIMRQLLQNTNIMVYALVRCSSEADGLQRIVHTAVAMGWWKSSYDQRVRAWPGDLGAPNLGLKSHHLDLLVSSQPDRHDSTEDDEGRCVHAIVHNGAKVHYSSSYETLVAVNVHSTMELLRLTGVASNISTFVFVSGGRKPTVTGRQVDVCSDEVAAQLRGANGYTQTKFVSEQLVRRCVDHSVFQAKRFYTLQPGYIVGSLDGGRANRNDFIWRLVAGCLEIGAYNRDESEHWLFMADGEYVASCLVSGLLDEHRPSGDFEEIRSGLRFADLWNLLQVEFGYEIEGLPHPEWMERLRNAIVEKQEQHLLFPLLDVLENEGGSLGTRNASLAADSERMVQVVRSNVKYLIDVRFLPKPRQAEDLNGASLSHLQEACLERYGRDED